jgi:energy-coupling factor transporter transmembrane protein EcfT
MKKKREEYIPLKIYNARGYRRYGRFWVPDEYTALVDFLLRLGYFLLVFLILAVGVIIFRWLGL